jgi:hypothetical protein
VDVKTLKVLSSTHAILAAAVCTLPGFFSCATELRLLIAIKQLTVRNPINCLFIRLSFSSQGRERVVI